MALKKKKDASVHRIMEAAMEVFSEMGYFGARVDEIARRAGVNKAMIYYRIGDKQTLYTEIIQRLLGDIAAVIQSEIPDESGPEEKLKYYIRGLTQIIVEHPFLPGIMMSELASGGKNLNERVAKDFARVLAVPKNILSDGIEKGIFIKINPMILHMMVVGFMMFFRTTEPLRKRYFSESLDTAKGVNEESIGEAMAEIERLILRAIKK